MHARALIGAVLLTLTIVSQAGLDRPHTERWFQTIATTLSGADHPQNRATWHTR